MYARLLWFIIYLKESTHILTLVITRLLTSALFNTHEIYSRFLTCLCRMARRTTILRHQSYCGLWCNSWHRKYRYGLTFCLYSRLHMPFCFNYFSVNFVNRIKNVFRCIGSISSIHGCTFATSFVLAYGSWNVSELGTALRASEFIMHWHPFSTASSYRYMIIHELPLFNSFSPIYVCLSG